MYPKPIRSNIHNYCPASRQFPQVLQPGGKLTNVNHSYIFAREIPNSSRFLLPLYQIPLAFACYQKSKLTHIWEESSFPQNSIISNMMFDTEQIVWTAVSHYARPIICISNNPTYTASIVTVHQFHPATMWTAIFGYHRYNFFSGVRNINASYAEIYHHHCYYFMPSYKVPWIAVSRYLCSHSLTSFLVNLLREYISIDSFDHNVSEYIYIVTWITVSCYSHPYLYILHFSIDHLRVCNIIASDNPLNGRQPNKYQPARQP